MIITLAICHAKYLMTNRYMEVKICKLTEKHLVRTRETPDCVTTNYCNSFLSKWLQNYCLAK